MATIKEDYVSFETAKLLKENGFDEFTRGYYLDDNDKLYFDMFSDNWNKNHVGYISTPTIQMAMKWLRELHNLHIMVNCVGKVNYDPIVQRFDGKDFEIEGTEVGTTKQIGSKWVNVRRGFKTYENACEAAIKYCLENLI